MSRLRTILVVTAGLVLIASSAAHSLLGWPPLSTRLAAVHAPVDLVSGFDAIEVVFLIPGVLLMTAALLPRR